VVGGCGSAGLAAAFGGTDANRGIGLVGVSLAFGLTVLTMAFAIGHISGCHLNPAVTLGLVAGGRHPAKEVVPYIVAQTIGGVFPQAFRDYIAYDVTGETEYDELLMSAVFDGDLFELPYGTVKGVVGIEHRRPLFSGTGVEAALEVIRAEVPRLQDDRVLAPDIEAISALMAGCEILEAAEEIVGPLTGLHPNE